MQLRQKCQRVQLTRPEAHERGGGGSVDAHGCFPGRIIGGLGNHGLVNLLLG